MLEWQSLPSTLPLVENTDADSTLGLAFLTSRYTEGETNAQPRVETQSLPSTLPLQENTHADSTLGSVLKPLAKE